MNIEYIEGNLSDKREYLGVEEMVLHGLSYCSIYIMMMSNCARVRLAGHVVRIEERRNVGNHFRNLHFNPR
jgi:hypothetical protein